jgi:hypothetical protein
MTIISDRGTQRNNMLWQNVGRSLLHCCPRLSQYDCCLPFPCIHAQTMNTVNRDFFCFLFLSVSCPPAPEMSPNSRFRAPGPTYIFELMAALLEFTSGAFLLRLMLSENADMQKQRSSFAMLNCRSFDFVALGRNMLRSLSIKAQNMSESMSAINFFFLDLFLFKKCFQTKCPPECPGPDCQHPHTASKLSNFTWAGQKGQSCVFCTLA